MLSSAYLYICNKSEKKTYAQMVYTKFMKLVISDEGGEWNSEVNK